MARNRLLKRRTDQLARAINREFAGVKNVEMVLFVAMRDRRGELGEPYMVSSIADDDAVRVFVENALYLPEGES